jgi:hypothetical protein
MIISTEKSSSVFTNTTTQATSFKIKAGAKAFKILSSFYSDPILAIPRELGANAWDSHVAAKNNEPFLVHAPNMLEPWFSVRDYGLGLSSEDVVNIYTTYFESTKSNTNDYDGCMGLGSKTPFNYTDNFTVTSWFHGKKFVYNCFVSESSIPSIMLMAEESTTEPNGVEVKLGVKIEDISKFTNAITRAYSTFRHKPNIVGQKIEYPEEKYTLQSKTGLWSLRDEPGRYTNNGIRVYMGNYRYTVNFQSVISQLKNEDREKYKHIINNASRGAFDLYFEIGELDVAPNKEELQYDANEKTSMAIITRLVTACKEIDEHVRTQISVADTLWDAMGMYEKYFSYNSPYVSMLNLSTVKGIFYGGKEVNKSYYTLREMNRLIFNAGGMLGEDYSFKTYLYIKEYSNEWKTFRNDKNRVTADGSNYNKILFFYTNTNKIKHARIKHALSDYEYNGKYYVIVDTSGENRVEKFRKYFGIPTERVLDIECLPKAPLAKRSVQQKVDIGRVIVYQANKLNQSHQPNHYYVSSNIVDLKEIDSTKTYYYFNFTNSKIMLDKEEISVEKKVEPIIISAIELGLIKPTDVVYKIMRRSKKLLGNNFVDVAKLIHKHLHSNYEKYELSLYLQKHIHGSLKTGLPNKIQLIFSNNEVTRSIANSPALRDAREIVNDIKNVDKLIVEINDEVYCMFGVKVNKEYDVIDKIIKKVDALNKKYLNVFNVLRTYETENSPSMAVICNVINYVDEKSS